MGDGLNYALLVLAACSELPDLGVCGNGIVEADNGEACDGDGAGADTCNDSCELVCQTTAVSDAYVVVGTDPTTLPPTELFCPDARMGCGLDTICRAASGAFEPLAGGQPFDVRFAAVGDFDGDRIVDLVGTSATQIVVRLGSSAGTPFGDGFAQDAPSSESPIAIFDRPVAMGGSSVTLAVPTDGLALLTSDGESFNPDLDTTFALNEDGFVHFVVTDPDPAPGDVVMAIPKAGALVPRRIAIPPALPAEVALAQCGGANSTLIDIVIAKDRRSFVIVGRPAGAGWFACVYVASGNAFGAPALASFTAQPPDTVVLADIAGDACPELVVARKQPPPAQQTTFGFVPTTAGCTLDTAILPLGTQPQAIDLFDAGSVLATTPDRDELVMTTGVFRVTGAVLEAVARPTSDTRPWTAAAIVDINGDGHVDVVAGRKEQDDVDVVRGGAAPNVYRADTDTTVTAVVAGDFDGDFRGDAALVETGLGGDRVSILYGTTDGLVGPSQPNSRFGGVIRMARMQRFTWASTSRGTDNIDDLVISQTGTAGARGGVLIGDAPRLLTMPRFPTTPIGGPIGALAVGALAGTSLTAAAARPVNGASELLVTDVEAGTFTAVALPGFEIDTTQPLQVIATAPPVLVGFAKPAAGSAPTVRAFRVDGTACTGSPTAVGLARATDLDGDGVEELVITDVADAQRQAHVFPITGGATCAIGGELFASELAGCVDVARVGSTRVALCERQGRRFGLFQLGDDGARAAQPFADVDGIGISLVTGDFDGDAVPDLAVGVGRGADLSVQFLRQCPAHDVRGCR